MGTLGTIMGLPNELFWVRLAIAVSCGMAVTWRSITIRNRYFAGIYDRKYKAWHCLLCLDIMFIVLLLWVAVTMTLAILSPWSSAQVRQWFQWCIPPLILYPAWRSWFRERHHR